MGIEELVQKLKEEDLERFNNIFKTLNLPSVDELLTFKIHLEGTKFQGSLPSDLGFAIWKLQQSYYRFVSLVLYNDPDAQLSTKEKERYLLNFKIEKGSTTAISDYGELIPDMIGKVVDKMEPWQIFTLFVLAIAAYAGKNCLSYLKGKHEIDADVEKRKHDDELIAKTIQKEADLIKNAYEIGVNSRTAILKGVTNISKASIGLKEYSGEEIIKIKTSRRERTQAISNISLMHVAVEYINSENKNNLILVLKEKDTQASFKANVDFNDEEDNTLALDILWNSARYEDRYFWAEVLTVTRRDKVEKATILNVAENKADLEPSDEDDI